MPTTPVEVFYALRDIIVAVKAETVNISKQDITPQTTFSDPPLAMDSLDFVQVVVWIEERFGVIADDQDMGSVSTVGELCDVVSNWSSSAW